MTTASGNGKPASNGATVHVKIGPAIINGKPRTLQPTHLADLHKSGLSDETIAAAGFYSEGRPEQIGAILNWPTYGKDRKNPLGDCLVIPFRDRDGKETGYRRLKPGKPRSKNGKLFKYESPCDQGNRLYVGPGDGDYFCDAAKTLVITEGEKKTLKALQEGIACVGLVGVWGWCVKREKDEASGPKRLIADLAAIAWQGRTVYLCFDSDAARKKQVRQACFELADVLQCNGATVKVVNLPDGPADKDGVPEKVGLDDFLVARGAGAFWALTREATDPEKPAADHANELPDDPDRLARLYLKLHGQAGDVFSLHYWRENWHRWEGGRYRLVSDDELRAQVHRTVKDEFDFLNRKAVANWTPKGDNEKPPAATKVTRRLVADVLQATQSHTTLPADLDQPTWLDESGPRRHVLVSLNNGLLDVEGLLAGHDEPMQPHSARWFAPSVLPYNFDPDADCPRWLAFLARNLEGDAERVAILQEWAGYCLTPDTSRQKFLVIEGEGANGKSVVCAVLVALLGGDNCSFVPLELFDKPFQLTQTLGKLANVCTEVGELEKAAEGFLKSFTVGEPMHFDRKHRSPISAVPSARLVLATNNRPRFSDRTDGLWRRMILMPFRVTIAERERVTGMDKPTWWAAQGELPGIFNWALAGLYRLRQQDRFTRSAVCEEALNDYRTESNPAKLFLKENVHIVPLGRVLCKDLYGAYRKFCETGGFRPLSEVPFGKEVKRSFPTLERQKVTTNEGRPWAYLGITRNVEDFEPVP